MRELDRNKQDIFYALYEGKSDIKDENGYDTGETEAIYGDPIALSINVSGASGENAIQQFGSTVEYDRILVICDTTLPINEQTILWIDDADTTKPYDYTVKKIAKSLNSLLIAVKKVEVSKDA